MTSRVTTRRRVRRVVAPFLFAAVVAVAWELGAANPDNILLPKFSATVGAFVDIVFVSREVWEPLAKSNLTMVIGFLISAGVGIPLGLLLGRRQLLDRAAAPYVSLFVVMPAAPLLPILVMVVGFEGITAGVLLVIFFALVYIVTNTRAGIQGVDWRLVEMAHSYGANEAQQWRFVLIPGALPVIATGLRIGLGRAFAGMVVGELLLLSSGIGLLLQVLQAHQEDAKIFAVVLVLLLEASIIGFVMRRLERALQPPS